jgi:hypothetical protein
VKRAGIGPAGWSPIDDPTPESGLPDLYGWGSALATGRLDNNANLDLAIGNSHATSSSQANAGEARVVIYQ